MREVHIYTAEGVWGTDAPEPVLIRIENEIPALDHGLPGGEYARLSAEQFAAEGDALAEAIWSTCPGGTVDALIAALLTRRGSLLRVTHSQEK